VGRDSLAWLCSGRVSLAGAVSAVAVGASASVVFRAAGVSGVGWGLGAAPRVVAAVHVVV
jgi:hypothetical protein